MKYFGDLMKLRALVLLSLIVLLTVPTSLTVFTTSGPQELIEIPIVSGYAPNEYIAVDGYGEGWGPFTETNDYTDTFYYGGPNYYVSDALTIKMVLVFQLPVLSFEYYDSIVFNAEWRFTASAAATGYWSLGNSTGGFVAEHNNLYSYYGTDSGYENVTTSLDIDIDVITAQNSTGHLSFIMSGAGAGTYGVYCDRAFLSVEYEDDFASQTVDGETYLTPDPTQFLATYGSYGKGFGEFVETNDYTETWTNDGTIWKIADTLTLQMIMFVQLPDVSKFDRIVFHADWRYESDFSDTGYWCLGNSTGDIVGAHNNLYSYTGTDSGYEEIEIALDIDADVITAQNSTGYLSFIITTAGPNDYELYCDFAFVSLERDFVESFSDVSDWADGTNFAHADDTFTTDGDVITKNNDWGGGTDYDYIYTNSTSITINGSYYIEFRIRSTNLDVSFVRIRDANGPAGNIQNIDYSESSDWQTIKAIITLTSVESVWICGADDDGDSVQYVDYIRIGPSNEMGWSHDGSTTEGITSTQSSVSDWDIVNHTATGSSNAFDYFIDSSTTETSIDTSYYPFFEISIDSIVDGNSDGLVYLLRAYASNGTYSNLYGYGDAIGIFRFNLYGLGFDDVEKIRVYVKNGALGDSIAIDSMGLYGVANWTITQSDCGTDDYLYASQGILYSNMDNGSIILEYDPPFFLNGSTSWNKTTSSGTSYLSFNHGGWTSYSASATGNLFGGTTTGLRIKFNSSANVIDIQYAAIPPQWWEVTVANLYFDTPTWNIASIAELYIYVALLVFTIDNYFFVLLGLVLIPVSTLYIVRSGKNEGIDSDKIFFFFLIFFVGWALFLGGLL